MYFRENGLSPRQNAKNRCYILIAETIGNLLAYASECASAKARLVGNHFKAEPFRGRFLLNISLHEKVFFIHLLYRTVDIPHSHPNLLGNSQPFSASVFNYKEHAWLRKMPETLCIKPKFCCFSHLKALEAVLLFWSSVWKYREEYSLLLLYSKA